MATTLETITVNPHAQDTGEEFSIIIPAEQWQKWIAIMAEIAGLKKRAKAIEKGWNLPEPATIAEALKLTADNGVSLPIINGNSDCQGKMAVYWHSGSVIPAGWRKRIS